MGSGACENKTQIVSNEKNAKQTHQDMLSWKHTLKQAKTVQEPTDTSKQPIRTRYLSHVTGYQPIRDPDSVGSYKTALNTTCPSLIHTELYTDRDIILSFVLGLVAIQKTIKPSVLQKYT
eukprot:sb/3476209/